MSRSRWFVAGLAVGLTLGVGMLVGAWFATHFSGPTSVWEIPLNATATHGAKNMALATGQVDDGIDGAFFLDFVTGELQGVVMNRRTGQVGGVFKHQVVTDLGVEKDPSYLMVTGRLSVIKGVAGVRWADSLIWVADANTGKFVVYALPWDRNREAAGQLQTAEFQKVFAGTIRDVAFRNQ